MVGGRRGAERVLWRCGASVLGSLFLVGAVFDGSRASLLFITSAYVTEATGSPRYVQLTGTCLMVMLLLGPCFQPAKAAGTAS